MGNYLKMADRRRIEALLELGWSYRRIQRETGVDRETVARYDPGRDPKSAKVPTGSQSACEPYRQTIEAALARCRKTPFGVKMVRSLASESERVSLFLFFFVTLLVSV